MTRSVPMGVGPHEEGQHDANASLADDQPVHMQRTVANPEGTARSLP